jgi:hypothetical protein
MAPPLLPNQPDGAGRRGLSHCDHGTTPSPYHQSDDHVPPTTAPAERFDRASAAAREILMASRAPAAPHFVEFAGVIRCRLRCVDG